MSLVFRGARRIWAVWSGAGCGAGGFTGIVDNLALVVEKVWVDVGSLLAISRRLFSMVCLTTRPGCAPAEGGAGGGKALFPRTPLPRTPVRRVRQGVALPDPPLSERGAPFLLRLHGSVRIAGPIRGCRQIDRGQVSQAGQAKLLEEGRGGGVENGPTHTLEATGFADQLAGQQGPQRAATIDPADGLDLRPGYRLAVGDNGQHLQSGAGEAPAGLDAKKTSDDPRRLRGAHELGQFAVALMIWSVLNWMASVA